MNTSMTILQAELKIAEANLDFAAWNLSSINASGEARREEDARLAKRDYLIAVQQVAIAKARVEELGA